VSTLKLVLITLITAGLLTAAHSTTKNQSVGEFLELNQREIDLAKIAELTLDAMGDDDGVSIYKQCEPKYLQDSIEYYDEADQNAFIEACYRLGFQYERMK
jgi:hypothetical protein